MPRLLTSAAAALALAAIATMAPGCAAAANAPSLKQKLHKPVPASLVATLKKASMAGLSLGTPPSQTAIKMVDGPGLGTKSRVGLLYVGADFCPYCAGQRWALILTLLRFGKLEGLHYMLSSPKDAYPNTPTFSFEKAKYTSDHLALQAVETADRMGHRLMKLDKTQEKIFTKYDAPPYVPTFGGIPFIYLDGQYVLSRPMLVPEALKGKDWKQAAATLADPESQLFQKVMPKVNTLTAAICRLDGGNPDKVCSAAGVIAGNGLLMRLKPTGS